MPGTDLIKSTLHKKNRVFPSIGGVSAAGADDGVVTAQIITPSVSVKKETKRPYQEYFAKAFWYGFRNRLKAASGGHTPHGFGTREGFG